VIQPNDLGKLDMNRKLVLIWIISSFVAILLGAIWTGFDRESNHAFNLYFGGIISSLLSVGYYSTPSNSIYGKISFAFVVITVVGIVFKILHYFWGNEIIVIGLAGIFGTYIWMWAREKRIL
jgi:hypothetical protein